MDYEQKVKEIIVKALNVAEEDIDLDTTFVDDLGADSLDLVEIVMGIEAEFKINIEDEDAEKIVTVGDAIEKIKSAVN